MDWIKGKKSEVISMFSDHPFWAGLATIGTLVATKTIYNALSNIWKYFLRSGKDIYRTYGGLNVWAIVTGASSGIGLEYSRILAQLGFSIIMIARNAEKLEQRKQEILSSIDSPTIAIQTLSFDFSKPYSEESYKTIVQAVEDKEIAILVNNVGTDYACDFTELPNKALEEMVNVNVNSITFMSRIVIPKMALRGPKRSAIINVSSSFTGTYMPSFSMYIATKAYMNALMKCLAEELRSKRIDVLTCLTGEVRTPRNPMSTIWHANTDVVVKGHLAALGKEVQTYGCFRHLLYAKYLKSSLSGRFKHWLGETARRATLTEFKSDH